MTLRYIKHEKIKLRHHTQFNETWIHDRICEDPTVLGLGDVRVIDRERRSANGGRLDVLLYDEDNERRYEVELMLGATDPSHIIRTIEYWDLERKRYPAYDHVAVLIAEDITTRFLNVISLLSGSIPLIAIQLDALRVNDQIVLNFVSVLDQTDLRIDDLEEEGGRQADRAYWTQKVGPELMGICDAILGFINSAAQNTHELHYLQRYVGLRTGGVVDNFITMSPKPTKNVIRLQFRSPNAETWRDRFEAASLSARSPRKNRCRLSITPEDFKVHGSLIREAIIDTVAQVES